MQDEKTASLLELEGDLLKERLQQLTPDNVDLASFTRVLKEVQSTVSPQYAGMAALSANTIDCCGTGGSGIARFNTSTAVAFVLAAAGMKVAKFGNRAASSRSGSFDFLDAIGFSGTLGAEAAQEMLARFGLAFIFAPDVYPDLVRMSAVRKELGHPTVLNFVGPLLNPCQPRLRLMGVSHARMQEFASRFISNDQPQSLGAIVRSSCGLDEICPRCGAVAYLPGHNRQELAGHPDKPCAAEITSEDFSPASNAKRFFSILNGDDSTSDSYHIVIENSAQALILCHHMAFAEVDDARKHVASLLNTGTVKQLYLRAKEAYETYAH